MDTVYQIRDIVHFLSQSKVTSRASLTWAKLVRQRSFVNDWIAVGW